MRKLKTEKRQMEGDGSQEVKGSGESRDFESGCQDYSTASTAGK